MSWRLQTLHFIIIIITSVIIIIINIIIVIIIIIIIIIIKLPLLNTIRVSEDYEESIDHR